MTNFWTALVGLVLGLASGPLGIFAACFGLIAVMIYLTIRHQRRNGR